MIGYCVPINPRLASFRLRVALPSRHLGMPHVIGGVGKLSFFYKNGNPSLAARLPLVVYDVVNPHFGDPDYRAMCEIAHAITCPSDSMAALIKGATGKDATVIPDPYENAEGAPRVGENVLWFGHEANLKSLEPYEDVNPIVCTGKVWTLDAEAAALHAAGLVLLTGGNPGASVNRPVKALRAGRFVVAPEDSPPSWLELSEFIWIGDVREGIAWALANREEVCRKVLSAQSYIRNRFSPQSIGSQWAGLFASTLGVDITTKKAG